MQSRSIAIGLKTTAGFESYQISLKAYQENVALVRKLASKYCIPIISNRLLAEILENLSPGEEIPKELLPVLEVILDRLPS